MKPYTTAEQFVARFGEPHKKMKLDGKVYDVVEQVFRDEDNWVTYKLVRFEKVGKGVKMDVKFIEIEYC